MPVAPIDIDFTQDPQYVAGFNGYGDSLKMLGRYEDTVNVIPESQWKQLWDDRQSQGVSMRGLVNRIYDQKSEGSCVANAAGQAHEVLQAKELGKDRVTALSAISLYKRIGSSAGSGAYIGDAMDELKERGILPLDTPENRQRFGDKVMPATGFRESYPRDWENTAKNFKIIEAYRGSSRAEMFTALFNFHPICVGRAGHSIMYADPIWDNDWLIEYANSWGNWGDAGYGRDSSRLINQSAGEFIVYRSINTIAE